MPAATSAERSQRFGRIVIGGMMVTAFVVAAAGIWGNRPFPEILSELPKAAPEGDKAFQARIKATFPAGSRESDLQAALDENGFSQAIATPDGGRRREWHRSGFECTIAAEVTWRAAPDGTLAASDGHRTMTCR